MSVIQEAIAHFEYGITHDIFSEPVTSYAKAAIAALRAQQDKEGKETNAPTNAALIRIMNDEELAKFLAGIDPHCCNCPAENVCRGCSLTPPRDCAWWLEEWLQQPSEEDQNA